MHVHTRYRPWQARGVLSRRGLRPEAFISPGEAKDETVVFISADGRLHVRSAAVPALGSEASLPWLGHARMGRAPPSALCPDSDLVPNGRRC